MGYAYYLSTALYPMATPRGNLYLPTLGICYTRAMKKLLAHIKESLERDRECRKRVKAKQRENYLWEKAGRPTGPGCDQSWRKDL